jgi:membrane-associated phospholipid phosphatase
MAGDRQTLTKWLIVLAIVLIDAAWIALSDFTFAAGSALKVVAIVSLLLSVGWFYRVKRPMQNFEVMCSETALLLAFSTAGAVLSYLVTSFNLPLIDPYLVKSDAMVGFDWLTYAGFVNHRPWLSITSTIVYVTTISQVALCVIALGLSGRISRGRQLGAAVIFSGLICVLTAGILPSAGALGYLRPGADVLGAGQHIVDLEYKQVFFDLRSGAERFISLDNLHGLVAFPSYHGTLSALVVISLWAFRFWRWPALALNFCVILATPVEGGHHLTDALSGVAVAFLAWHLAAAFMRKVPATPLAAPVLEPHLASAKG